MISARPLVAGTARGPVLRLAAPISFWGGVDPASGVIMDPRHPDHGACVTSTVLALESSIGSSSSSSVMLELLRLQKAPAALLLGRVDAILALGVVVAREMGYPTIPVLQLGADELAALPQGATVVIEADRIAVGD